MFLGVELNKKRRIEFLEENSGKPMTPKIRIKLIFNLKPQGLDFCFDGEYKILQRGNEEYCKLIIKSRKSIYSK